MQPLHNHSWMRQQIKQLEKGGFEIEASESMRCIIIRNLTLQGNLWSCQGQLVHSTSIRIDLPVDFPLTCPGVGFAHPTHAIHIPSGIQWNGHRLGYVYPCRHQPWDWFCFQGINWNPKAHGVATLIGVIEQAFYERREYIEKPKAGALK